MLIIAVYGRVWHFCRKSAENLHEWEISHTFAIAKANYVDANAQMAELVDALVSNTSGVKSIPVRSRVWVRRATDNSVSSGRSFFCEKKEEYFGFGIFKSDLNYEGI